mgnify:CR=1 FL=1
MRVSDERLKELLYEVRHVDDETPYEGVYLLEDLRDCRAALKVAREALLDCREYFDNRMDVDYQGDPMRPVQNREAVRLGAVDRALAETGETP